MSSWVDEIKARPVLELAGALGLATARKTLACPACHAETRGSRDRRLPAGTRDGRGWLCHRCGAKGSGIDLAAHALLGRTLNGHDRDGWAAFRTALFERGLICASDDPIGASRRTAPVGSAQPCGRGDASVAAIAPREANARNAEACVDNKPLRPPIDEVRALWDASARFARTGPLDELDAAVTSFMARRNYWPPWEIEALDLVRVLPYPQGYQWPAWWPRPWASTWRLVMRAWEPDGTLASMHARAVVDTDKGKTRWPKEHEARGLLFADAFGHLLLRGEAPSGVDVVVVEGLTGVLWQSLVNRREGRAMAVLGGTAGSWHGLAEVRWPTDAVVYAAVDEDETGNRYATAIRAAIPASVRVRRARFEGMSHG